ncbi:hypothetical protein [Salinarimonas chemoclinalis]|uniref:hypothetical protein n=1 Tax=Salinarimonas chemoclinalis TaxID=3241599 RepID=UPI003557CAAF
MAERPKNLEYYGDIYGNLLPDAAKIAEQQRASDGVPDARTRDMVATSVAQALSLTPASFIAKFDEVCDCAVKGGHASETEASLFRRLGHAYARRDESEAGAVLDEIGRHSDGSALLKKVQETLPEAQAERRERHPRRFWQLVGGYIGLWIGAALGGGWYGAALGFKIGYELAGVIYDRTGGGPSGSNVMARPNGEPCTQPVWL